MRILLKSKIYDIKVTSTNLNYEGSLSLDSQLMRLADILEYEQIHVLNVNTGARFLTYALEGKTNEICVNGAAARLASTGDPIIILSYHITTDLTNNNPIIVSGTELFSILS